MSTGLQAALVVLGKECRESLRDRRVLLNALVLGPLFTPVLFLLLMHLIVGRELEKAERPLPLAIIGAEYAPALVAALVQQGAALQPAPADPEQAVREQRADLVLRVSAGYAQDWRAGRPAQVELIFDSSRSELRSDRERLQGMLEAYSARTGSLRLLARGVAPALASPLLIASRDQATPQARAAVLLGMLPYFLILTALIGGMWLAIDATAGERERQTLEALLVNPVGRGQVLLGKWMATALFSLASLVLGLLAFVAAGQLMPGGELGLNLHIGPRFVLLALLVMLPLVLLIAVAQIWVASFARSFREAQTYLGLAQLVPLIPSILLMAVPMRPQLWMALIPLFGQQVTVLRLLRGEDVGALPILMGTLSTLVAAAGFYALALRVFRSERLAISG